MLRQLQLLIGLFICAISNAQDFTTIWNTTNAGASADNEISIPTNPTFTTYNYSVDWGDGTTDTRVTGDITHTYAIPGTYTLSISGAFPAIYFNNRGDRRKIIEILSWGNIEWQSMEAAFYGCQNLNFDAIDAPDLSNVTTLQNMFRGCSSFNGIVNNWDVSSITNISGIFSNATVFNRPLDSWVTNAITNMSFVFENARLFNEPLDNWNTGSVVTMKNMFASANQFNQDINNWIVNQVTNMAGTFASTSSFNRPLNNWNVANVTTMESMFSGSAFTGNIVDWEVNNVTNMSRMFSNSSFNRPIGTWNVSSVTDMSGMFSSNRTFNQPLNDWDVSNVINMSSMFRGSGAFPTVFNQPLDQWDVSKVTDMSSMFEVALFNQPINDWDVSAVTNMSSMFSGFSSFIYNFNQPLDQWDVSNVTNMTGMFQSSAFNRPIGNWDVANVENMGNMFNRAVAFNQPLDSWILTSITDTFGMFQNTPVFNQPLNSWTVSNVTSMRGMFLNALAFNQPLSNWDTASVINMENMFGGALVFNQSLADWNIGQVAQMGNILNGTALTLENYDATLIGWAAQSVNDNVNLGANGLTYCDGRDARQDLIDNHSWIITGDTVDCSFVLCTSFLSPQDGDTNVPANFDLRWSPAPNADGYNVSVSYVRGGVTTVLLDNSDQGNVVGIDFTNDFLPGDIVTAQVVPYNSEGPATGCDEITFTVVPNWRDGTDAFKLTIDTDVVRNGYSGTNQLRITARRGLDYNYSIDWGDNQFDNNVTGTITHSYLTPGVYTIAIIGDYPAHYYPGGNADNNKLLTIDQWGTIAWETLADGFRNCTAFIGYNATDTPDLSQVTDLTSMFESSNFNGNINDWDVGTVELMNRTFIGMSEFNQPLNDWDVSSVTSMIDMFLGTTQFNQPLSNWVVSNVTDMRRMFDGFNRDMAFNQNLNDWDVSNVTNMTSMFSKCVDFNFPLNNWVTSSVTAMTEMFDGAESFNQDINNWNVSAVIDMRAMFRNARSFNQSLNSWEVCNVLNTSSMFAGATSFNGVIRDWDVTNVITMEGMFRAASTFNENIDSWEVTNVINMSTMFEAATAYNAPLNSWDVNSVVNMVSMFKDATVFNQPLEQWNVSAVANMSSMFENAVAFDQVINNWNVSSVTLMPSMFEGATSFNSQLNNWNVASVTNMEAMFKNASTFNQEIGNWDTGEVLTMREMFSGATLFNQDINNWDVSFVTTMQEMFRDATTYNQSMDSWNVASVRTMEMMFQNATAFNGVIGSWNVRGVTTMENMFNSANAFNQEVANWRVTNVQNMNGMFQNAVSYDQHMDGWILGASTMQNFLRDASSFNQSLAAWDVSRITNMQNMLDNTSIERMNYDDTLIAWSELTLNPGITFGALTLPYCDALEERQSIIDTYGWNIVGDVRDCPIPECTILLSPRNDDSEVPVNTNISWEPSLYARGYRLTVGTTQGGNDVVDNEIVNNETSYEFPSDFNPGDVIYVTLIPFNDEGDAVGPCREESFTISSDPATLPECTTLTQPLTNTSDIAVNTDISWAPISNADGYRLTIGTTTGGVDILDAEDVGNVTTYDLAVDLPEDSDIFITITPYNDEGGASGCSEERFTTEVIPIPPACTNLANPLNNATDVPLDTAISWNAIDNATGYLVIVGTTSGGVEVANNIDVGNVTSYDIPGELQQARLHYVTIIPYNDEGDAMDCDEESFMTGDFRSPPSCTSLINPIADATGVSLDTNLSWAASNTATGYLLSVGTTMSGSDIFTADVGNVTTYDLPNNLPESTLIYITITPYNGNGNAMGCATESFTTNGPPSCTTLINPADLSSNIAVDTNIEWNVSPNADGYRITVTGSVSTINNLTNFDVSSATTYNFTNNFETGETVTVTIVPYNGIGSATGCSTSSFTIETVPSCTNLTTPMNSATGVPLATNITWNAIDDATSYRVTVDASVSAANNQTYDVIGNTIDFPNEFTQNEVVTVTIIPYNDAGDAIGCTAESFTIMAVPACTNLISPVDGQAVAQARDISWNPIADANGYRLTVSGNTTTTNDITDLDINGTTYVFPNEFAQGEVVTVTIIPFNEAGDAIDCTMESFTIRPIPTCTSLVSPINNAGNVPVDTDIVWNDSFDADGYRISIGTTPNGTDIVNNEDVASLTDYILENDLPSETLIYVTIVPYNTSGDAVGCSSESFETAIIAPGCTELTSPSNGATDIALDTAINWEVMNTADGYRIAIGTTPNGTDIVDTLDLGPETSYTPTAELPLNTRIFVTITSYNSAGEATDCVIQSFTTLTPEDNTKFGFSPNGDGINDYWHIENIQYYPENTVSIFNRWGDMVFTINGYDNNGTVFSGEANQLTGFGASTLPEGTYFFQLQLPEGHILQQTKGYLVLKR